MHGAECSAAVTDDNDQPAMRVKKRRQACRSSERQLSNIPNSLLMARDLPLDGNHYSEASRQSATATPAVENQSAPWCAAKKSRNQSRHIVGPAMARDAQVLEQYMSSGYNTYQACHKTALAISR
jgi:hypothetical protein